MCLPLMAEGEFALVKEHLAAADKIPDTGRGYRLDKTELYFMLADIAVQERDEAALRQYAPLAEETATHDGHLLFQAVAYRAWGVLHRLSGDYGEAKARLNKALDLFEGLETWWQIGRTLFELGDLARAAANPSEARDLFSRALEAFEEIGAAPDAGRVREALESMDQSGKSGCAQSGTTTPPKA